MADQQNDPSQSGVEARNAEFQRIYDLVHEKPASYDTYIKWTSKELESWPDPALAEQQYRRWYLRRRDEEEEAARLIPKTPETIWRAIDNLLRNPSIDNCEALRHEFQRVSIESTHSFQLGKYGDGQYVLRLGTGILHIDEQRQFDGELNTLENEMIEAEGEDGDLVSGRDLRDCTSTIMGVYRDTDTALRTLVESRELVLKHPDRSPYLTIKSYFDVDSRNLPIPETCTVWGLRYPSENRPASLPPFSIEHSHSASAPVSKNIPESIYGPAEGKKTKYCAPYLDAKLDFPLLFLEIGTLRNITPPQNVGVPLGTMRLQEPGIHQTPYHHVDEEFSVVVDLVTLEPWLVCFAQTSYGLPVGRSGDGTKSNLSGKFDQDEFTFARIVSPSLIDIFFPKKENKALVLDSFHAEDDIMLCFAAFNPETQSMSRYGDYSFAVSNYEVRDASESTRSEPQDHFSSASSLCLQHRRDGQRLAVSVSMVLARARCREL